jgi:hypothetical protein
MIIFERGLLWEDFCQFCFLRDIQKLIGGLVFKMCSSFFANQRVVLLLTSVGNCIILFRRFREIFDSEHGQSYFERDSFCFRPRLFIAY